jgi:hypothetical protein
MLLTSMAEADTLAPLAQDWRFDIGVFFLNTDTTVRVDGTGGATGSDVDLKHDFAFGNQHRIRLDGYWRFFERHKLRFMYFDSRSDADRTIDREIQFGDVSFPVNAFVHASVNAQILELAYEYSFLRSDSLELAGSFGLHNLRISTELSAAASSILGGGGVDLSSTADGNGPLPVIGLRFIWALNDQFYFDGQAQFFAVKIDTYDGSLQDYKVDFVWQPFKNFGMGVGYNDFAARLNVSTDPFNGKLKLGYGGPLVFITVAF